MEKKKKDISEPDLAGIDDLQFNSASGSTLPIIKEPEKDATDENNIETLSTQDRDINIFKEIIVDITNHQLDNNVLLAVIACLNIKCNGERKLTLRNINYIKAISSDLDKWFTQIEQKIMNIFVNNTIDYIKLNGDCSLEVIQLVIKPAPHLITLDTHLYYPAVTRKYKETHTKAVDILCRKKPPGELPVIKHRIYKLNHTVEGIQNENADIQFKVIRNGSIPTKIADYCPSYISAFGNYIGGVIYFGIEDMKGTVEGVDLSSCSHEEIEEAIKRKICVMRFGEYPKELIKGEHWDIQYFKVEGDGKEKDQKEIIAVRVCSLPGGVFTNVPESYYIDDDGIVQKFNFENWRYQMLTPFASSELSYTSNLRAPNQTPGDNSTSPKQIEQQGGPKQLEQEGSPKQFEQQGSPKQFEQEGSLKQFEQQGSLKQFEQQGSPKQFEQQGSPKQFEQQGSPQQVQQQGAIHKGLKLSKTILVDGNPSFTGTSKQLPECEQEEAENHYSNLCCLPINSVDLRDRQTDSANFRERPTQSANLCCRPTDSADLRDRPTHSDIYELQDIVRQLSAEEHYALITKLIQKVPQCVYDTLRGSTNENERGPLFGQP